LSSRNGIRENPPAGVKGKSGKPDLFEVIYGQFEHGKERE
jgi:hypothetical protein